MDQAKKWDDKSFWTGISVGDCIHCSARHVLRHGLCWACQAGLKAFDMSAEDYANVHARIANAGRNGK